MASKASRARSSLRDAALAYPGAHEDFPWGECVVKVNKKVFVFLGRDGEGLSVSVKLPTSAAAALTLPFAEPTGYGLGRGGWVTASFGERESPPLELLREWIDESYRAVTPKKLAAAIPQPPEKVPLKPIFGSPRRNEPPLRSATHRRQTMHRHVWFAVIDWRGWAKTETFVQAARRIAALDVEAHDALRLFSSLDDLSNGPSAEALISESGKHGDVDDATSVGRLVKQEPPGRLAVRQ